MKNILVHEDPALLLARVGMGEGARHNQLDVEYVMWTVKARSIMGVSNGNLSPSTITDEVLYRSHPPAYDYASIGALITAGYPTWYLCATNVARMGAPCADDLSDFISAYQTAQTIVNATYSDFPEAVSGYDSFTGENTPIYKKCNYGDKYDPSINRPTQKLAGASVFYDCWHKDNILLGSPKPAP